MNVIFKLLGIVVLILSILLGWYWQSYDKFISTPVKISQDNIVFNIPSGTSLSSVAHQLSLQGIISDESFFLWMFKFDGRENQIKAGEYVISAQMTPKNIADNFVKGKEKQYPFTIVEGWTFKQLLDSLGENKQITHQLSGKTAQEIMAIIGHPEEHPEGRFLPDTYHFPTGTTDEQFLQRAYIAMQLLLETEWKNRKPDLPYKSAYEALTMASIVEKETGVASERKQIAGVFVRRLNKRMRLQTDPTVIYGMGDNYTGNLRKKDLKKDTPYNTYRRKGLPPTPIALPGQAAIHAALNPLDEKTLYFVAKGDGSHYFSETIKAHNKAVRKYQIRQRKADYRSSPQGKD